MESSEQEENLRNDNKEGGRGQSMKDLVGQDMEFLLHSNDCGKTLEGFKQQRELI